MNVLTDSGYKDIESCVVGEKLLCYDTFTHEVKYNELISWEAITKEYFEGYYEVPTGEVIETWYLDGTGVPVSSVEQVYTPDKFEFILINNTYKIFKYENVWCNKGIDYYQCKCAFELAIGDIIYNDNNDNVEIIEIDIVQGLDTDIYYILHVTGDHSFIADNLTFHNASKYWDGTSSWTNTTTYHWYTDDTHTVTTTLPVSTDDAIFDSYSTGKCTSSPGSPVCRNLDCTGYSAELQLSSTAFNIYGNITFSSTMTLSDGGYTGRYIIVRANPCILTMAGKTFLNQISVYSSASLKLNDSFVSTNTSPFYSGTAGTINANSQSVTFSCSTNVTLYGAYTYYDLTINTPATATDYIALASGITITENLTCNGNSVTNRYGFKSNSAGTRRTVTLSGTATTNLNYLDIKDIAGAGASGNTWFANNILTTCNNLGNNTGLLFPMINGMMLWFI